MTASREPRPGWLRTIVLTVVMLGLAFFISQGVAEEWPMLRDDFAAQGRTKPAPGGHVVEGSCRTSRYFLTRCEATLEAGSSIVPTRRNKVVYSYFGGSEQRPVQVLVDTGHPETLTTDVAMERLWNRTAMMAGSILVGLAFVIVSLSRWYDRLRPG
ncbi:hypothetical protein LPC08_10670 [Roseomonas sp. OT10]|uniref:hypothetical protein n=1 Tax=Roseomonas cutis TaxID=2897332 RepID=UPI001E3D7813|nr:hypothetical protein [Roseomonas sp. OT10]UFN51031.1 hypothetical protein LPC08_10670 [Roseomonas sp. OT10]